MHNKIYKEKLNINYKEKNNFIIIRNKNHQIYSINQTKYILNNYDNKYYWYSDFKNFPFGHYIIKYLDNEKLI